MNITGLGCGFDYYVMNSDMAANKVIRAFEQAISQGYFPNDIEQEIYRQTNVNPNDLSDFDKNRIQLKVSEIWEQHCNSNGGYR